MNYKKLFTYLWLIFILLLTYHVVLYFTYNGTENIFNTVFNFAIAVVMVYGGIVGLWGLKQVSMVSFQGRGLFFISLATLGLGIGFLISGFYPLLIGEELPYPSLADYVWLLFTVFNVLAYAYFLKIMKVSVTAKKVVTAIIIFLIAGAFVTYLIGYPSISFESGLAFNESFFNFYYSISDLILIALSIIILSIAGGKIYKGLFIYNLGMIFQVIADVVFSYQIELGTAYDGDPADALYTISGFLFSLGIIILIRDLSKRKEPQNLQNNQGYQQQVNQ